MAIICFVVVLIFILAPFGIAGPAGDLLYRTFNSLFGVGYYLVPVLALILGISLLKEDRPEIALTHSVGSLLFLGSGLALVDSASIDMHHGGLVGQAVFWPFMKLFGIYAGIIFVGLLRVSQPTTILLRKNFISFGKNWSWIIKHFNLGDEFIMNRQQCCNR